VPSTSGGLLISRWSTSLDLGLTHGRARGAFIVADGHIRAGSLFAHAIAALEDNPGLVDCYERWFRFFVDAMVLGDPVIPFGGGYNDILRALNTPCLERSPQVAAFQDNLMGFTAFLLAHEAAHILHDHASLLSAADDVLALSRDLELEADKTAIDLLTAADRFSTGGFSAWQQWHVVRTVVIVTLTGEDYRVGTTHPPPVERYSAALCHVVARSSAAVAPSTHLVEYFEQLIQRYETELLRGEERLFPMRNRPAAVLPRDERILKRITMLHT
jgi:hypothetical protein